MARASTVLLVLTAALLAVLLFFAGAAWRARITATASALSYEVTEQAGRGAGLFVFAPKSVCYS